MQDPEIRDLVRKLNGQEMSGGVYAFALKHQFTLDHSTLKLMTKEDFKKFVEHTVMLVIKNALDKNL